MVSWLVEELDSMKEAEELVAELISRRETVATAESCTGGLVAAALTDIPGVSACYPGGVVSYANEVKQRALDVSAEILETCGAVSPECAEAMASGVVNISWSVWTEPSACFAFSSAVV